MTKGKREQTLIILNDPPYGTERSCNGMRLANALSKGEDDEVRVFLVSDAVICAKKGPADAQRDLQPGADVEGCLAAGRHIRGLRYLYGRPWNWRRGAGRRCPS